ncbi:MAG TPA: ABC transporter ATP-binding protein [Kofleriaceae bacterium]|nr:ABC transporter ATP-binding protein [Kofleriaceae bacterium]
MADIVAAPAIELHEVALRFGEVRALERLSLHVPRGTVFGFLGPNGAGKTSTLRILLGLLRASAGTARVLGLDPTGDAMRVRAQVGVLLEHDGLYDRLSALANLEYHARIHHLAAPAGRIEELLRRAGLWDRRRDRVTTWSKGMRQKLAVARALLHRPPLVLLDEPFSGLDPVAAAELRDHITGLARDQGTTVFLTTHDLGHVEKICQTVAVITAGEVVARGAPGELAAAAARDEVEIRGAGLSDAVLAALTASGVITSGAIADGVARVTCGKGARGQLAGELARHGVQIEELRTVRASLEDAFLALMGAK